MEITAFLHEESGEPMTIDADVDTGLGEDGEKITLREIAEDCTQGELADIHVVSENAVNIALHVLHQIAQDGDDTAKRWALAGLRELAFYDMDGLELTEDPEGDTDSLGHIAADPGREAVDKIRCGTHLLDGTRFFVPWPGDPER